VRLFEGSKGAFRSLDLEAKTLAKELLRPLDVLNAERDNDFVAHCDHSLVGSHSIRP
jgi:hypothetical protein